jgi:hypothetical protein
VTSRRSATAFEPQQTQFISSIQSATHEIDFTRPPSIQPDRAHWRQA